VSEAEDTRCDDIEVRDICRKYRETFALIGMGLARARSARGIVMSSEYSGDEKLLTKGEVAQLCRVDVRTVDRWVMAGKVGCHRTPSGRVLFRRHDVLRIVARRQTTPRTPDR
jgi:excisionase family DNA binding protein